MNANRPSAWRARLHGVALGLLILATALWAVGVAVFVTTRVRGMPI